MKSDTTVVSITTPRGTFVVDSARDAMLAHNLRPEKHHQESAIQLLECFITKRSVVVDAGAHIGTFTVPLARTAARVIAFEPSPKTYALLVRNIALNGLKNIDARMKGLGAAASHAHLAPTPEGNAGGQTLFAVEDNSGDETSVFVTTLDAELDRADVIKIDVEGMELDLFRGAERLLAESKPVLFFEINIPALAEHQTRPADIAGFLEDRGYQLFFADQKSGQKNNRFVLGRVRWLWLVAFLIAPGSFLFGRPYTAFDIVALPKKSPKEGSLPNRIQIRSWPWLVGRLISLNMADKVKRLKIFFRRS